MTKLTQGDKGHKASRLQTEGETAAARLHEKTPKSGDTKLSAVGFDGSPPKHHEAELPTGVLLPTVHQAPGTGRGTRKWEPELFVSHRFGADTPLGLSCSQQYTKV